MRWDRGCSVNWLRLLQKFFGNLENVIITHSKGYLYTSLWGASWKTCDLQAAINQFQSQTVWHLQVMLFCPLSQVPKRDEENVIWNQKSVNVHKVCSPDSYSYRQWFSLAVSMALFWGISFVGARKMLFFTTYKSQMLKFSDVFSSWFLDFET